ncbi:unnamed protein product [Rhizoctonia solani]|uniref:Uncharacterized protein n=1 Tax=Rhizoctonia solani TaxID=456999 RepID=A0A8H3H9Q3_9AGAM|nr:unnamed protein product [Rhizoctonia solani]
MKLRPASNNLHARLTQKITLGGKRDIQCSKLGLYSPSTKNNPPYLYLTIQVHTMPLFVGGYKFQPEDLAPLSPNVIGVPYKPGLMEGSTVFKLKAMLKCDILPIIDDTELGNHYYMLITQSNESGQGFPFTEDEEDIRQFAAMEAWGLQHREWVVLQDPKLTVITR